MEQDVLVPASLYNNNNNKILISEDIKKQELPEYQTERNPTYQIVSLKKEVNKNLFAKANSLVDKILSCPRIKLSNSHTFLLVGVKNGTLLSVFNQQLRRKRADVPETYFTLLYLTPLVFLPLWFGIKTPQPKRKQGGYL